MIPVKDMDIKLFEPLVGSEFQYEDEEGKKCSFLLEKLVKLPEPTPGENGVPPDIRSHPFNLVFHGKRGLLPLQTTVKLSHPNIGELEGLFCVAFGENNEYRYYDITFT